MRDQNIDGWRKEQKGFGWDEKIWEKVVRSTFLIGKTFTSNICQWRHTQSNVYSLIPFFAQIDLFWSILSCILFTIQSFRNAFEKNSFLLNFLFDNFAIAEYNLFQNDYHFLGHNLWFQFWNFFISKNVKKLYKLYQTGLSEVIFRHIKT